MLKNHEPFLEIHIDFYFQIQELENEIIQLRCKLNKQAETIDIDDDDSDSEEEADDDRDGDEEEAASANGTSDGHGDDSTDYPDDALTRNRSLDGESFEKKRCLSNTSYQ